MKLVATQRSDYAVRAVVYLVTHGEGHANGEEIGEATGVPATAVRELMQILSRAKLVRSRAGRYGGYSFCADSSKTSVRDIVEAVEGPIDPNYCEIKGVSCQLLSLCSLHEAWQSAQLSLQTALSSVTVRDLKERIRFYESGEQDTEVSQRSDTDS